GSILQRLLPVEDVRVVKPLQGFPMTLTREGRRTPFLEMEATPPESAQRWAQLPPHFWGGVGRAKPAAAALAYYRDAAQPPPKADEDADERLGGEQALLARQHYGHGQVLFVGVDSTWRWRYQTGDTYHHRFWGQVIRWAASDHTRFDTDKAIYQ